MLDLSDDEELQRLREAALKSKRKPGVQDKTDESDENKTSQTVPVNPPIQVQVRPPVFPPFYAPPPPLILPRPLALPQPLPGQQLNSLHFNAYPPHFLTHPQAPLLNRAAPIKPRINNKKLDFSRKSSPGCKASNLIVITGNESDNFGRAKVSRRHGPSNPVTAKIEESIVGRPQDRGDSDKDQLTLNREERAKVGKFDRYKSNESSEDENYISPSDDSDSKSDSESDRSDSEETNAKDVETNCAQNKISLTEKGSADEAIATKVDSTSDNDNTSDVENEHQKTTSKSPERKRMLSFSDDVEDLQLDIPDSGAIQDSKAYNDSREEKKLAEKFCETSKKSVPSHERPRKKLNPSRSPLERYRPPSLRNREKSADHQERKVEYRNSKADRLSSKSQNTRDLVIKVDALDNAVRKAGRSVKDNDSKRSQSDLKRKYSVIREECYERSPEALRAYRKARYFDDRDHVEYPNDYPPREYSRGYAHHHPSRLFEKSDTYPIREFEDHYVYPEERREHEDYHDRAPDYYRPYPDSHENHYRYSPPPQKRYRAHDRDRYSSEREVQRVEMSRRYEGEHHAQRPVKRTHLNTNHIPSLLDGIFFDGYTIEDNLRLPKSRVMRSEGREQHSKQSENSRTKEAHENKSKKSSENFRYKDDKNHAAKDALDRKPPRRVVEPRNGDKERGQDYSDFGIRSRNQDPHSAGQKTNSISEKKSNHETKSFERKSSIHHRLGSKPDRKSNDNCKMENTAVVTA